MILIWIQVPSISGQFKHRCHERFKRFCFQCLSDLHSGDTSIARTYRLYESSFGTECYLRSISNPKSKVALSKLRASSRDLEIEHGRYVRPRLNIDERLCLSCNVVENEEHFVTACKDKIKMFNQRPLIVHVIFHFSWKLDFRRNLNFM